MSTPDDHYPDASPLPTYRDDGTRRVVVLGVVAALLVAVLVAAFLATSGDGDDTTPSLPPQTTIPPTTSTSSPETTVPQTTVPVTTTTSPPSTSSSTSTLPPTTTTTIDPYLVAHQVPFAADAAVSWASNEHHDYPAADIFSSAGCGTPVVSPVAGTVDGFEGATTYTRENDDPANRGGNWVSILGDDGVRYYLAHFQSIDPTVTVGLHVTPGAPLGLMGDTGRAGACHTHFAISPGACPVDAWWVRRGVIWPSQYLDAWRAGETRSPVDEVNGWLAEHPTACTDQAATGFPVG